MTTPSPTSRDKTLTYIGDEWMDKERKWSTSVKGADGCIYGIPFDANRVVRFDPATKSLTSIGIDLGDDEFKWECGVLADNGFVYSTPYGNAGKILKIDTNAGATSDTAVSTIDIPDGLTDGAYSTWVSGDKAADGKLYFMPLESTHILRIDPNDDSMALVGNKMEGGSDSFKYGGTVATPDGCVYGIPAFSTRIIKFDPANPDATTTVGAEADTDFQCSGGVLAEDGNIYAMKNLGGILKIDVSNDTYSIINIDLVTENYLGWGDPIRGHGDLLYFPPINDTRVMVFHTTTQEASLVGPLYSTHNSKWYDGALAPNGKIYSIPCKENHILEIDPSV
mmetsp:Transcript_22579/g.25893  ORF Transcript_22579/g.25893 Transcript_22579/m.25893 type:complete len:337 (-) Transcript_22579:172-1182(-)